MSKQITMTVIVMDSGKIVKLRHDIKNTVLDTLREGGINLPSLCSGMGKCGRCSVKFHGYAPLPTQTDRRLLAPERLREGYRFSCTARPLQDCEIETAFIEEKAVDIVVSGLFRRGKDTAGSTGTIVAVDLGTTTIAMQLLNAGNGEILDTYTCRNPQSRFGTDVVERIRAGSGGNAAALKALAREAVWKGVEVFLSTVKEKKLCKPTLISIAGNTVMGHLFMGYPTDSLGKNPFLPVNINMIDFEWNGIRTILVPGISAFIGGDITAGLLSIGMNNKKNWLFLDLGTNAEMILGAGGRLYGTAAAAGPAFEGKNNLGSERIHAAAGLLGQGIVDETGLLKEPYFDTGIQIGDVFMEQKDIRDIQLAKAAVRTGIYYLMEKAGLKEYGFIDRVYLAGGLGFYLDKRAAAKIGLIPVALTDRTEAAGNTSLAGAGLYGRRIAEGSFDGGSLTDITGNCNVFNLALEEKFEENYINYINFDK